MCKVAHIWSDGSCSHNQGKGGYAAVIMYDGKGKIIYGSEEHTTNNRMELTAFISGIRQAINDNGCKTEIVVYTDSKYIENAINCKWINRWNLNGYKGIKNPDLWRSVWDLLSVYTVEVVWVKGHADVENNKLADEFAVIARVESIPAETVISM